MSNNQSEPIDLKKVKLEYRVILNLVPKGSSVLDLGCGDGELLNLLIKTKNVRAAASKSTNRRYGNVLRWGSASPSKILKEAYRITVTNRLIL